MPEIADALEIDISTAHRLIKDFERLNILKEKTGFKRNRLYVFQEYLNLFEQKS
jgi:DNA-binding MarR family transcriptional regulator